MLKDNKYTPSTGITDINAYTYDNNGNQLRKAESQSQNNNGNSIGATSITLQSFEETDFEVEYRTYDPFNRMTSVKNNKGVTASYAYQANNLRYSKTVNGKTSYFYWNPTNQTLLVDFENGGQLANISNIYSRGIQQIKNNHNTYYSYNGHGDVTSLTNSNGNITKTYDYDAFGVEINKDENDINPFRYCGECFDNEINDIYLRARYYSPSSGRFTTEDPIRSGLNWYTYCMSNSVNYYDKTGLAADDVGLRKWLDDRTKNSKSLEYNLRWNNNTKTATATMTNTYTGDSVTSKFTVGKNGDVKNSYIQVSNKSLWDIFGDVVDPPIEYHPYKDAAVMAVVVGTTIYGGKKIFYAISSSGKAVVPQKAKDLLKKVESNNGTPPKGYKGGKTYNNMPKNGGAKLPDGVNYKEYDVNPNVKGIPRDGERIVIGSDGSAWYTNDHYQSFTRIK